MYYIKKPVSLDTTLKAHIKEGKFFSFPGYRKPLTFSRWSATLNIEYEQKDYNYYFLKMLS